MYSKLKNVIEFVEGRLSAKRFTHVNGVIETAKMLAERHAVNVADAELAALVHDVAKEQDIDQMRAILRLKGEFTYLEHSHKVWHAPLGAIIAKETFGIENPDILNAIKFHTTGRPEMSDLEKVIFVADYTEPNRKFEGAIAVREFWGDLDRAVYEILKQKVEKNTSLELSMHPDTLDAYEYYKRLVMG